MLPYLPPEPRRQSGWGAGLGSLAQLLSILSGELKTRRREKTEQERYETSEGYRTRAEERAVEVHRAQMAELLFGQEKQAWETGLEPAITGYDPAGEPIIEEYPRWQLSRLTPFWAGQSRLREEPRRMEIQRLQEEKERVLTEVAKRELAEAMKDPSVWEELNGMWNAWAKFFAGPLSEFDTNYANWRIMKKEKGKKAPPADEVRVQSEIFNIVSMAPNKELIEDFYAEINEADTRGEVLALWNAFQETAPIEQAIDLQIASRLVRWVFAEKPEDPEDPAGEPQGTKWDVLMDPAFGQMFGFVERSVAETGRAVPLLFKLMQPGTQAQAIHDIVSGRSPESVLGPFRESYPEIGAEYDAFRRGERGPARRTVSGGVPREVLNQAEAEYEDWPDLLRSLMGPPYIKSIGRDVDIGHRFGPRIRTADPRVGVGWSPQFQDTSGAVTPPFVWPYTGYMKLSDLFHQMLTGKTMAQAIAESESLYAR